MKAIVYTEYGPPDVLRLQDVEKPTPGDNEVLIRVHASSVNAGDWHMMRADPFIVRFMSGLIRPKDTILGADVAGVVEAVGRNVTQFKPGDEVFGDVSGVGMGAFAEYVCATEAVIAPKPAGLTFEEAAAVPAGAGTALQGLRNHGNIQSGQRVLINGASGSVGMYAVQIAKAFNTEVTGVCSTKNLELVGSLGADHVIDYTRVDFTKQNQRYDLIHAANGYHPITDYKRALASGGTYVMSGGALAQMFEAMLLGPVHSLFSDKKMCNFINKPNRQDLLFIKELIEAGKIKPVIERVYPLAEVPDAIRYMEDVHAGGKLVIRVVHEADTDQQDSTEI